MNQVRLALRQIAQLPDLTAWIAACEAKQADPLWCDITSDDLQEQTSHAIDHLRRLESLREAVIAADDRMSSPPKLGPLTRAFLLTWRPRLLDEGIDPED
jgi:hypothetical protein